MLKGRVASEVRSDLFGHEGETETARTYDEEVELSIKLNALQLLTPLTEHIAPSLPINIRPLNRLRHGNRGPASRLGSTGSKKSMVQPNDGDKSLVLSGAKACRKERKI